MTGISDGFLVTKVRYHRDIAPRSSCNDGWRSPSERFPSGQVMSSLFWPFFDVLLLRLRFRGKLSSGITSIRYHLVERCTMLHKNYLSRTHWTTTQLTMQQGSERTRVKSRTSRLDSRALDRSKTKRLIPRAQLTPSCYELCAACSNVTSSRRRARANNRDAVSYKCSTVQYSHRK